MVERLCQACGKPAGTGTLLDFQPEVPPAGRELGHSLESWQRFAERYRCPVCADPELEATPDDSV